LPPEYIHRVASVLAFERVLPLTHWLGAETARNIEQGQARTRLICTFAGLCGFVIVGQFAAIPAGIVATAIVFPLYAIGMAVHIYFRPTPTRARRGLALLMDNLVNCYIASFGGPFAAYVGFNFLTTIGWGLRFGRHYLCLATLTAVAGMLWNLAASPYWRENMLFGGSIIFGMLATSINTSMLLRRISLGNRRLAEKMDEIAQLAWRDPLTRLPNRLQFRERLVQALAAAGRNRNSVALLLFDIDGFKAVNDQRGHPEGDRVLAEVGSMLRSSLRRTDQVFRYGGDEFAALCPETSREMLGLMLQRVSTEVGKRSSREVKVSLGGSTFPTDSGDSIEIVRLADERLYACKRLHHLDF